MLVTNNKHLNYFIIWNVVGYLMISSVVYLSLTGEPPVVLHYSYVDKIGHLLAYGTLMAWFSQLYLSKKYRIILAALFCLMGISLEFFQEWGGRRSFEYADMLADAMGVFLGWWISSRLCAGWLARVDQILSHQ
jgi:VanZ family protein